MNLRHPAQPANQSSRKREAGVDRYFRRTTVHPHRGFIMPVTIFYFSGTGNSLKVAKDLASALGGADLIPITKKKLEDLAGRTWSGTVGIVFPVYFAGLPHIVRRFAGNLRVEAGTYLFAVATFGGLSGLSFDMLAECLGRNGIRLSAAFGILMPGNYQVMYAPAGEATREKRFREEAEAVAAIARTVAARGESAWKPAGMLSRLFFGFFYNRLRPADRDRHFRVTDRCTECGTCARVCPANNITIEEHRPRWHHRCEYCLACLQWCPVEAIQYDRKTDRRGRYHHPDIWVQELFRE
jgi:ferredoxin